MRTSLNPKAVLRDLDTSSDLHLSEVTAVAMGGGALAIASLLYAGHRSYPELHAILDMGMFVLSGVLAMFFWNVGGRVGQVFPQWAAASLGVTSLLEGFHMLVTVEWSGRLIVIAHSANLLLPATWPPQAYTLPVGLSASVWLLHRNARFPAYKLGLALLATGLVILPCALLLPRYTEPLWLGITRPTLIPVPFMWLVLSWQCWKWRSTARSLPPLVAMSLLLAAGSVAMLYSRFPNDTAAMLAHLLTLLGFFLLLTSKMKMASNDLLERFRLETKFRGLLESAPDAIVVVDTQGRMKIVNSQTESLFGYGRDELLGRGIELLIPPRSRAMHPGHVAAFFASPHARPMGKGLELHGMRRDGTEFPVEISLSPLQTDEGMLVSAAIRDVTSRRQAEDQIRRLNRALEERAHELTATNQELEAFTYTAAHDLRAPLRHLHGYSTFLKEAWYERLDEEGRHFLDRIMSSTKQMATLLDELLNFSRLGRVELQKHTVSLTKLVERVREDMSSDADVDRVKWQIEMLPEIEGDLSLLHQVMVNLISNAVKYSRKADQPQIMIGSEHDRESGMVNVFVRDNGAGFDMQYANKLFQVFQRLHRAKEFEGTGIGLAIVRRIVERHGGRVWAEGAVDQGATFYFSLPNGRQDHGQARVHSAGR